VYPAASEEIRVEFIAGDDPLNFIPSLDAADTRPTSGMLT